MNQGGRNLDRLIAEMEPRLYPERYAFDATVSEALGQDVFALIREDEGVTAISVSPTGEWARVSLGVHSSLEAVGLTAAVSARLAKYASVQTS